MFNFARMEGMGEQETREMREAGARVKGLRLRMEVDQVKSSVSISVTTSYPIGRSLAASPLPIKMEKKGQW